ncbi:MAG: DUF4249 domain-containing protein [Bacteroidia bacterium]|jgi:hypothetical protein|nr:DUF4249 domain-containing protein [Bacteroidia bacterium]
MKNNIFKYKSTLIGFLSLLIVVLVISSCEKVVNIDLNSKDPQIVIEGIITDQPGSYTIKLTNTANFDELNNFPSVSSASVIISDNAGNSETLTETSAGIYTTSTIQGTIGRTYTLKVTANGKEYSAVSKMPSSVNIDTLNIVTEQSPRGSSKTIYVNFVDPIGTDNYYRFIKIINGVTQKSIYVEDDLLKDGEAINQPLFARGQDETKLKPGYTVTIELQSIDKDVYDYFRTLLQLSSSGLINQSASPANPLSNISNGALGYFNACAVTSKTIIVQ